MASKAEVYQRIAYPALSKIPAESVHDATLQILRLMQQNSFTMKVLEYISTEKGKRFMSERLKTSFGGVVFENPFMTAAGFDKNGVVTKAMWKIGFGGSVIGTVTNEGQKGDKKPRIHRIENGLLNHMALPNDGIEKIAWNVSQYSERVYPLGISVGLNKDANLRLAPELLSSSVDYLYDLVDFFEINASCLNIVNGNVLQDSKNLEHVVKSIIETMINKGGRKPLSVKISADISVGDLDQIIDLASQYNLGIVAVNTSLKMKSQIDDRWKKRKGVVSGKLLLEGGTMTVSHIHKRNPELEVIGCGGIDDLPSVLKYIGAGAGSGLQIYTGFVLKGPTLPSSLSRELDEWMDREGVNNISELVGQNI